MNSNSKHIITRNIKNIQNLMRYLKCYIGQRNILIQYKANQKRHSNKRQYKSFAEKEHDFNDKIKLEKQPCIHL